MKTSGSPCAVPARRRGARPGSPGRDRPGHDQRARDLDLQRRQLITGPHPLARSDPPARAPQPARARPLRPARAPLPRPSCLLLPARDQLPQFLEDFAPAPQVRVQLPPPQEVPVHRVLQVGARPSVQMLALRERPADPPRTPTRPAVSACVAYASPRRAATPPRTPSRVSPRCPCTRPRPGVAGTCSAASGRPNCSRASVSTAGASDPAHTPACIPAKAVRAVASTSS